MEKPLIVIVDVESQTVALCGAFNVTLPLHDIHILKAYLTNRNVVYVSAAEEAEGDDVVNLVSQIAEQVEPINHEPMYIRYRGDEFKKIPDTKIIFAGSKDAKPLDKLGADIFEKSAVLRKGLLSGEFEILTETEARSLRKSRKNLEDAKNKQLESMILDSKEDVNDIENIYTDENLITGDQSDDEFLTDAEKMLKQGYGKKRMSDILLIQMGHPTDTLIATSLLKKFTSEGNKVHIVADEATCDLLAYFNNVRVDTLDSFHPKTYDMAINLSPSVSCTEVVDKVDAEEKLGFGKTGESISFYNKGAELYYRHRYIGAPTRSNLFQLTYGAAGQSWHGEGYYIPYFPRNRAKKSLTGLAIKDKLLRDFVNSSIKLEANRIYVVPLRTNLFKQIDELNRCSHIVTDDNLIMHLALALHKNVQMIVRKKPPYAIEMFGSGNVHVFDSASLKESK